MAKSKKAASRTKNFKFSPVHTDSSDVRAVYITRSLLWAIVLYLAASWAIDSGSMWVYAIMFFALYSFVDSAYKAIVAIIKKQHIVKPSGKTKKA